MILENLAYVSKTNKIRNSERRTSKYRAVALQRRENTLGIHYHCIAYMLNLICWLTGNVGPEGVEG
jgi:hypothetical protein